jgi:hypothetical protein
MSKTKTNSKKRNRYRKAKKERGNNTLIYCMECNKTVMARLTRGREIYPRRPDLHNLPYWICDTCSNYVGCHYKTEDSTRPLGCIPNAHMKKARRHIHILFDSIWRAGLISRRKLYKRVSQELGVVEYHAAELESIEEAREVYRILLRIKRELQPENSSNS